MKISTKGRYGLRILIDLAAHDPEKPRMLKDIAQSQQISSYSQQPERYSDSEFWPRETL